jgi:hypothetical protein
MAAQNPERDIEVLAAQAALLAEQNGTALLAAQTALLAEQNRARELNLAPEAQPSVLAAQTALLAEQNRARELDKKNVRYNNLRSFL